MRARALKDFSSSYNGNVTAGQIIELPTDVAIQMEGFGMIELIRTTESQPSPLVDGPVKQSVSSRVAPASQESKLSTSKESAELSPSTQATKSPLGVTSSTPQTESGGSSTTAKRRRSRKSGAVTGTAK